ncbi:hypothetical protein SRABI128_05356 [Microbacterium sp. Bi128]|nr:hypothetical protein SRABI128_05356 [Microbacterium sp. Bi128]
MNTATTATEIVEMSSRARAERKAVRKVPMVRERYSSDMSSSAWRWAEARPRPTRTGRPLASSSMCPESRASADWASLTRSSVYRPIRIMNSGTSGTVSTITTALTQSANRMRAPSSSGMAAQFTSAGRNWV